MDRLEGGNGDEREKRLFAGASHHQVMDMQIPQQFTHGTGGVPLETQVTMAIQLIILAMLGLALYAWKKNQLTRHGKVMGIATVISLGSFFIVMLPVFLSSLSDFLVDFQNGSLRAQVNLAHAFTGVVAVGLSVYVTGRWAVGRFRVGKSCYSKTLMRVTIGAWIIALGFGILVYLAHVLEWM